MAIITRTTAAQRLEAKKAEVIAAVKAKTSRINVDIYIKERNGNRKIRIPWLPEQIDYESGGTTVASYDIMNRGEVVVPTGTGLTTISWESEFPGKNRTDTGLLRGSYYEPEYYHKILEDWRTKGTALNVMVTGYPINKDVILTDYTATPTGGFGDMQYRIELTEDRDIKVEKTTVSKNQNSTPQRPAKKETAYTIKKGDTLWAISKRFLGSGNKWKTIYNANKSIIESTARKYGKKSSNNGWWIYPGCKITIPQ